MDDTVGNTGRYVWSNTGMSDTGVRLYDIDAASNNQIITYATQPRMDDYTSINQIELSGSVAPSTLNTRYKAICVAGRRAFVGNLKMTVAGKTKYYNDRMIFSPQNVFDIFPNTESNILDLETSDGDEIVALASYGNKILQFKKSVTYILDITGEASNWTVEDKAMYKGILSNKGFCETGEGIFWFNKHGAYLYDGEEIKDLFLRENEEATTKRIDTEIWSSFVSSSSMCGFNPKSKEIFVLNNSAHSTATAGDAYIYNLITKSWVKSSGKFFTSNVITNFINIGDTQQLGFFTTTDPGVSPRPKGESNDPGVPF